jgi:hypothetical protein
MKKITLYFFNENELGNKTNSHTLTFNTNIVSHENLYVYINNTYFMLLEIFSYYILIEE